MGGMVNAQPHRFPCLVASRDIPPSRGGGGMIKTGPAPEIQNHAGRLHPLITGAPSTINTLRGLHHLSPIHHQFHPCPPPPHRLSMAEALDSYVVRGLARTNINFLRDMMTHPKYLSGNFTTKFIEQEFADGYKGLRRFCIGAGMGERLVTHLLGFATFPFLGMHFGVIFYKCSDAAVRVKETRWCLPHSHLTAAAMGETLS